MIDISTIRSSFPLLSKYGKNLIYLDNASSTQKPAKVIDSIKNYYESEYANVHRGVHSLSQKSTDIFEKSREIIRKYINAKKTSEVLFTKGTTEGINLIAYGIERFIQAGDEILITQLEHHANIVPWQQLCLRKKAILRVIDIDENQALRLENIEKLIHQKTKLIAITHISNAIGTKNPIEKIITLSKKYDDIITVIDAAQSIQHMEIDVVKMKCDFLVFSGHKIYGPTGTGILYGKEDKLEMLAPCQFGGEMIEEVSFEKTTFNQLPFRMEAGTPNISGVIGLAKAIMFIQSIGIDRISQYEADLAIYANKKIQSIKGINLYGNTLKSPILSFNMDKLHAYDVGVFLDEMGIAVRTGHHCAQPLMKRMGVSGTVRASLCFYNTYDEIDRLIDGLIQIQKMIP